MKTVSLQIFIMLTLVVIALLVYQVEINLLQKEIMIQDAQIQKLIKLDQGIVNYFEKIK